MSNIIKKKKTMKKIFLTFAVIASFMMVSCEKDNVWGDGDTALEHVYYVGFYKSNAFGDYLTYEVAANGTTRWKYGTTATNGTWVNTEAMNAVSIPLQFHSERIRVYDTETHFWITNDAGSALVAGTDYAVSLESGAAITPNAGVYSLTWPQAKKGFQNVVIKRLTSATGKLKVNTLDPAKGTPDPNKYLESTVNNTTSEYEVRGFTEDYNRTTVNFN
jgi:hypothetical protein